MGSPEGTFQQKLNHILPSLPGQDGIADSSCDTTGSSGSSWLPQGEAGAGLGAAELFLGGKEWTLISPLGSRAVQGLRRIQPKNYHRWEKQTLWGSEVCSGLSEGSVREAPNWL